jgi:hypothetical protein
VSCPSRRRPRKNMFISYGTPLTFHTSDCFYKYYLAVAPLPSRTHSPKIGIKVPCPSRSCIQLWSLGPSTGVGESGDDKGEMRCEMVLCIDSGPALELKWCPLPSHDPVCPKLAASTRVYEAPKSCQGHLQPLRESWVCSLAYSKMAPCPCPWSRTRQILHQQNARRR